MGVITSIIEEIRKGMLLGKPVVYLKTQEFEVVRRVLDSDRIVVRLTKPAGYGQDVVRPFSRFPTKAVGGMIISESVINMACCTLKELASKICGNVSAARAGDASDYGLLDFADDRHSKLGCKSQCRVPMLLAVHIKRREMLHSDLNSLDALFPFVDRYGMEEDGNGTVKSSLVLLFGDDIELPEWLSPYCYIVQEPYPAREELMEMIKDKCSRVGKDALSSDLLEIYASDLLGNTLIQAEGMIEYFLNLPYNALGHPAIEDKDLIHRELTELKKQNVKRVGLLELVDDRDEMLGGMDAFKAWILKNKTAIMESDLVYRRTGAAAQKGILMCGIPGCGKSAAVKELSKELSEKRDLPILKMDIGRLMGGIVGDSEHNMHLALKLTEAMSPCILYIDEIEKGFSEGGARSNDSGVSKRVFGILLSWMQDCKKPVYMFATANSLSGMPKEFFRSGRFDSHFALYMPTYDECVDIFKKRMEKAQENVKKFDKTRTLFMPGCFSESELGKLMESLVQNGNRFITGADITKLVDMALRDFADIEGEIVPTDWIGALKNALEETSVYGDGEENLNNIAACQLRMLRLGFTPTSSKCMFETKDYSVTYDEQTGEASPSLDEKKKEEFQTNYDRALYSTISKRMRFVAKNLEKKALEELVR